MQQQASILLNDLETAQYANNRLVVHYDNPPGEDALGEIMAGLTKEPKQISPKFFYNTEGAKLFDRITTLPEYYLTRVEQRIYRQNCDEIANAVGRQRVLIEPGSGSSEKVQLLIDSLRPSAYVPLEITESHLLAASMQLVAEYPWLTIHAVCADYSEGLYLPEALPDQPRLIFFPGSTIGNFEPEDALRFLRYLRVAAGENGALLIGIDLEKDKAILNAAYNDSANVTARFNLNVLNHINQIGNADFDPANFSHLAFFNEVEDRVEMHLESLNDQQINIADERIDFVKGERIHTENSYKYRLNEFHTLTEQAGFKPVKAWFDPKEYFSVQLLEVV